MFIHMYIYINIYIYMNHAKDSPLDRKPMLKPKKYVNQNTDKNKNKNKEKSVQNNDVNGKFLSIFRERKKNGIFFP